MYFVLLNTRDTAESSYVCFAGRVSGVKETVINLAVSVSKITGTQLCLGPLLCHIKAVSFAELWLVSYAVHLQEGLFSQGW